MGGDIGLPSEKMVACMLCVLSRVLTIKMAVSE